jgi:GntR family transcriptional regulator
MTAKDRSKHPRYKQLAETLIADVRAGKIKVGATLPGELELVDRFGVSRHTVREALRMLGELGLIERMQGIGTVVKARESNEAYVQTIRTPAELMRYPAESRLEVVAVAEIRATRKLAPLLGCPTGARWTQVSAVRRLQDADSDTAAGGGRGRAICWTDVYVLPEFAGVARLIGRKSQPVYELIEEKFGEKVASVQVDLRAGLIPPVLATALDVSPGSASLTVVRRYTGQSKRVFEVSIAEHPAERYTYSLELKRGWHSGDAWTQG